jgi:hypothetical protein
MVIRLLVELLLVACVFAFVWTQIIAPAWSGTHWFPWFRKKTRGAEKDLIDASQDLEDADVEYEAELRRRRAAALRDRSNITPEEEMPSRKRKPAARPDDWASSSSSPHQVDPTILYGAAAGHAADGGSHKDTAGSHSHGHSHDSHNHSHDSHSHSDSSSSHDSGSSDCGGSDAGGSCGSD